MGIFYLFTQGYDPNTLVIGILLGIIIAGYSFFRLKYPFDYFNLSKKLSLALRIIISVICFLLMINVWSAFAIYVFYIFISSLVADLIYLIYKLIFKDRKGKFFPKNYKNGILAIIILVLILAQGVICFYDIENTTYDVATDKTNNSYTVILISDVHYGDVQDNDVVTNIVNEINDLNPDLVILDGDIVDEKTTYEEMKEVFSKFSKLNSTYGTYFIFGNHDLQPYYTDYVGDNRTFTDEELTTAIESNGIKILSDENIEINDDLVLIGRADKGWDGDLIRANGTELLKNVDSSKYVIIADHQPMDKDLEVVSGVDLYLSGHTHAGQVFPFNLFCEMAWNYNYGKYVVGDITQIVSSGLGGWGWHLRNAGHSEYVTININ